MRYHDCLSFLCERPSWYPDPLKLRTGQGVRWPHTPQRCHQGKPEIPIQRDGMKEREANGKVRGHCTQGFTCEMWDKYSELSLRLDTAGHKTLFSAEYINLINIATKNTAQSLNSTSPIKRERNKLKETPKIPIAQPGLLMKMAGADVTKHSGVLVTWTCVWDTWAHDKWATAVTEQTTSTSFSIHQRIKNQPCINLSFARSGERAKHFPLCVTVIGLLADRYPPPLLCTALGPRFNKDGRLFPPFCKETVSLMAFKTGSTTIKWKVRMLAADIFSLFQRNGGESYSLAYTHALTQTHTVYTDTLTFRHSFSLSNAMSVCYKNN